MRTTNGQKRAQPDYVEERTYEAAVAGRVAFDASFAIAERDVLKDSNKKVLHNRVVSTASPLRMRITIDKYLRAYGGSTAFKTQAPTSIIAGGKRKLRDN